MLIAEMLSFIFVTEIEAKVIKSDRSGSTLCTNSSMPCEDLEMCSLAADA